MAFASEPWLDASQRPTAVDASLPLLSVVVVSSRDGRELPACLASREGEQLVWDADLIIVRADGRPRIPELATRLPNARVVAAPPGTDIGDLRCLGLAAATGDVILFVDDSDDPLRNLAAIRDLRLRCTRRRTLAAVGIEPGVPPTPRRRHISVIMPAHQAADALPQSLAALAASRLPRAEWELIVVDDASTDETASVAARFADIVVRLPGRPYGPAYARNRGFDVARGDYLVFLDADVCVHADTLTEFAHCLDNEQAVSALFGSFDVSTSKGGMVSRYRNVLAAYNHQQNPGPANTFWSSCGAIRREAFVEAGMYDEWHFPRRQVEDFELGQRIRRHGREIVLRPEIQVSHLRRRTLRGMIAADLYDRALPWMRLFGGRPTMGQSRSSRLRARKRRSTLVTWLALILALASVRIGLVAAALAAACLLLVIVDNRAWYRFVAKRGGPALALAAVPLDLVTYLVHGFGLVYGRLLREVMGEPTPHPRVEAYAEVGVRMWPPVPRKPRDA